MYNLLWALTSVTYVVFGNRFLFCGHLLQWRMLFSATDSFSVCTNFSDLWRFRQTCHFLCAPTSLTYCVFGKCFLFCLHRLQWRIMLSATVSFSVCTNFNDVWCFEHTFHFLCAPTSVTYDVSGSEGPRERQSGNHINVLVKWMTTGQCPIDRPNRREPSARVDGQRT